MVSRGEQRYTLGEFEVFEVYIYCLLGDVGNLVLCWFGDIKKWRFMTRMYILWYHVYNQTVYGIPSVGLLIRVILKL